MRRDEISLFNVVCCLVVILVHTLSGIGSVFADSSGVVLLCAVLKNISVFVFEAFMFLSGLRIFYNRYDDMFAILFYANRIIFIVIPYAVFAVIFYLYHQYTDFGQIGDTSLQLSMLTGNFAPDMHFIVALIQIYLLVPLISRMFMYLNHKFCICISAVISLAFGILSQTFPILNIFFPKYIFFWLFGAFCAINYKKFKTFVRQKKWLITELFAIFLIAFNACSLFLPAGWTYALYITEILRMLYVLSAILFLFMAATAISDAVYFTNFILCRVDGSSYFVFLFHSLIIFLTDMLLDKSVYAANIFLRYGLRAASAFGITLLVTFVWGYIKDVLFLRLDY